MNDQPSRKERRERVREDERQFEQLKNEKRKFTRTHVTGHVNFITCDLKLLRESADIENVSQRGALFRTKNPPQIGDVLELKFDREQLDQVIDVRGLVSEQNGDILAKVVRVDKNNNEYDVAINFFKKGL